MKTEFQLSSIERQEKILNLLKNKNRVTVPEVCRLFSISKATARRDLNVLVNNGKTTRVRGGAVLLEKSAPELPMLIREAELRGEKQRIGKATAELINEGDTIFLGSGTTVLEVARNLTEKRNLTVLTNSLPIINLLVENKGINLIVFGGELRSSELSFIGHITEKALNEVRADIVIMGARAISLREGITNDFLAETLTDRAIIRIGKKVILVADYTKFGKISTAFLAPLEKISTIVTNKEISQEYIENLIEDIEVILT